MSSEPSEPPKPAPVEKEDAKLDDLNPKPAKQPRLEEPPPNEADDDGHGEIFKEVRNDTEYEMSEDEEDDEQTVAEEERLARKEGNAKRQEALELAALQKESEVPLEQLLAQYRGQNSEEKDDDDGHGEIFKEVRIFATSGKCLYHKSINVYS